MDLPVVPDEFIGRGGRNDNAEASEVELALGPAEFAGRGGRNDNAQASEVEFFSVPGVFTERGGRNDNAWSGGAVEGRADFIGFGFDVAKPNIRE